MGKKLLLLLFLFLLFPLTSSLGDTVYTYDDRVLRGDIIKEDDFYVTIKIKYGVVRIARENIKRIDRTKSPEEIHEDRLKKCSTANDYYKLGKWARKKGLEAKAVGDFRKALEIDPDHKPSHKALGHVYHRGRWWTKAEYNEKVKGLVYKDGRWMPKAEAERIEKKRIKERKERVKRLWRKRKKELKGIPWPQALQKPIETAHYKVYCNSSREVAQRYADFLEQLFDKFDKIFRYYRPIYSKQIRKQKSVVMIHRNYEEFLNMHGLRPGVGGFYRPKAMGSIPGRTVVAFHGSFGDTGNTFSVLAHEGTHQFEHLVMPSIMNRPTWIIEGLAVFFGDGHEITSRGKLKVGVIPRDRLATLQEAIKKGNYVRLKKLFRTPHARFSGFHYAHAWGVIYYMLDPENKVKDRAKRKKMVQIFQKFFDLNCKKTFSKHPIRNMKKMATTFEGMIQKELGMSITEFEKEWKKFIMSLELEPVGEIKGGNYFVSKKMKFKAYKPYKYVWKFETKNLEKGEKVAIINEKTTARVGIVAKGNMFLMTSREMAKNTKYRLNQTYTNLNFMGAKKIVHKGYDGYIFNFRGKPKQTVSSGQVTDKEQRYRLVILATLDNIYMLKFQADVDRFQENDEVFKEIQDRFELKH